MRAMDPLPAATLETFIQKAFQQAGLPEADARTVAALMVEADLQGSDGHGIFRLPQYVRRIRAGGVNPKPRIRIERERAATALVHGDNGMGHLVMKYAAEVAIEKARAAGSAWVGARWSNHAGPASLYAKMPMRQGMIGQYLAVGNANHLPPWGGVEMLLSTNPIAVAIPALEEPPIVLDMATTVAAFGKVKTRAQRGETMPEGWMVDRDGNPLTDPKRMNEGFLLPIGGYKGYGMALVFGILAGTLNGAAMGRGVVDFNADDASATNTGQAILAVDIEAFGEKTEFLKSIDALSRDIRGSQRMKGFERIYLPGEQSHFKQEQNRREGMAIADPLLKSLNALGESLGIGKLA
jgi:LDH2 family malate/lactate/ureidoglycolate dehydrogenase